MSNYTKHGQKRIRKRQGVKKSNLEDEIDKVLEEGLSHGDCKGKLKKYLDRLWFSHKSGYFRVYKSNIYIFDFNTDRLITMYALPGHLNKIYQQCLKKKEI